MVPWSTSGCLFIFNQSNELFSGNTNKIIEFKELHFNPDPVVLPGKKYFSLKLHLEFCLHRKNYLPDCATGEDERKSGYSQFVVKTKFHLCHSHNTIKCFISNFKKVPS